MGLALPDFTYRAEQGGVVEHELCPVVIAEVDAEPAPDPDEVDDLAWVTWEAVVGRVGTRPESLSPWSVRQVRRLTELAPDPLTWLDTEVPRPPPTTPCARRSTRCWAGSSTSASARPTPWASPPRSSPARCAS